MRSGCTDEMVASEDAQRPEAVYPPSGVPTLLSAIPPTLPPISRSPVQSGHTATHGVYPGVWCGDLPGASLISGVYTISQFGGGATICVGPPLNA